MLEKSRRMKGGVMRDREKGVRRDKERMWDKRVSECRKERKDVGRKNKGGVSTEKEGNKVCIYRQEGSGER